MIVPSAVKNCLSKIFSHTLKRGWNKTISIYKTEDNDEENNNTTDLKEWQRISSNEKED